MCEWKKTIASDMSRNFATNLCTDPIDILVKTTKFWELICVRQIRLGKDQSILQKSLLE